ncbi:uncharacterized protein GVI51_F08173 [Nakaseomyces glabratus]|uniref:SWR1-complex protein 4 n=1 Tax=Candida glabrata (strain ATCC 2001 / BCRC 20586 / JCM 3761 / NBRC 0622 / NRRL Y-65 / CBS 138) TaxID=284593 RepID=SWC4_CANGA|nr:uncharacterized protein CAGL0F08613g [Nakaseomyces glabratus]Q6FTV1.1 RecName: Full=SWR1-complex protein 4 [Nakaseomyces glabratus CBS 138]KAH7605302.1 SANT/Myb-like domain of DAMP1 [Nakaseomyces glabratus]KAH7607232.1 SANT/Myb-like domain of DAMP1 [Nakaseomyces glabratus]QHS65974.1 uncharacterized protein GVI51_F08173 [Nakaseomyces glabratus]CAG59267.1 unnamed protein product [Nakaseomyces glabratus]|eukprot:XP_446343.1 uncharacterized protein CAGL0F08613g [[Candida] glabrata]
MSSSDIFDVLNIKQKSSSPNAASPSVPASGKSSKPQLTGMQRELYNLLGENEAPVVVQSMNRFKEKLASNAKPTPWSLANFKANEYLTLQHWVKGSRELIGEEPQESEFKKYDVHLTIPEFTEDEYNSFIPTSNAEENEKQNIGEKVEANGDSTDVNMTEEDTNDKVKESVPQDENKSTSDNKKNNEKWEYNEVKYLFDLCKKYDLRWFVIQDRYDYENSNRTLEDLKSKFYEVSKCYFKAKKPDDPMLQSLNYSKDKETQRKKYLERLLARSAAEIAEEEALIIESRKFEMAAKKTLAERETLLRLLDSPQSDISVAQYLTSNGMSQLYNSLLADKSRKRKIDSAVPENPWMKQQHQFAQQRQQMQQLQQKKLEKHDASATPGPATTVTATETSTNVTSAGSIPSGLQSPKKTKRQKLELQTALKRKSESEYAEQLLKIFNMDERKSLGVIAHGEKLSPGVFLRSAKITTFKPAIQNKIISTAQELGIPARPVMPTFEVVTEYEALLKKIATLLDIKKQIDKIEAGKQITK